MNIAAEIGKILIDFQIAQTKKEADGGEFGDTTPPATAQASEPAHSHYARTGGNVQTGGRQ
jgi:hypothetical protein